MTNIPVYKDEDDATPIPTEWRPMLESIANAYVLNSFPKFEGNECLKSVNLEGIEKEIRINKGNIEDYPDRMGPLNSRSWDTSISQYMVGYWEVLVDLSTETGETSDLVLHARVYERGEGFCVDPGLIYVP